MSQSAPYKITAIVSVYNAEEFLRGCLEDLVQQTIFAQTEVIIIDACSPQNEGVIAQEFTEKYPNILYVRTPQRETLYAAWNRAIGMARGEYITNANADDRHAPHAFERLAAELDAHPEVALVYGKYRITAQKNAVFATAPIKRQLEWIAHDHINLLRRTEVGPQPLWRKSLHTTLGLFDACFTVAGDYDMWLRISEKHTLLFIPEELGLCLEYDNNLEAANPQRSYDECYTVKFAAMRRFMQPSYTPSIPCVVQLRRVSAQLTRSLGYIKQGQEIKNLSHLELQFFSYALLMARAGDVQNALQTLNLFYALITDSKNIAYIYRFLLLTSEGELPGHLRHEMPAVRQDPVISVILCVDAYVQYLEEALLSVLAQTETRWEVYLVDNGAEGDALEVAQGLLEKYNDERIRIFQQKPKQSMWPKQYQQDGQQLPQGQNDGKRVDFIPMSKESMLAAAIKATTAPYICVLEAKDMLAPEYFHEAVMLLQGQVHTATNAAANVTTSNACVPKMGWVNPKTLAFGRRNCLLWHEEYDFFASLVQCPCAPSAIFDRNMWEDVQSCMEADCHRADLANLLHWDFFVRAGEQGWTGQGTSRVAFMYRDMFQPAHENPQVYVRARQAFLKRHHCWFKDLSLQELVAVLNASVEHGHAINTYPYGMFPSILLQTKRVDKARAVYADKEAFTALITQWKEQTQ